MQPSSLFRFVFLVLLSILLLPGVLSKSEMSKGCQKLCKDKKEAKELAEDKVIDCGYFKGPQKCGSNCTEFCADSDCNDDGDVKCPSGFDSLSETNQIIFYAVAGVFGVVFLGCAAWCCYCCITHKNHPPQTVTPAPVQQPRHSQVIVVVQETAPRPSVDASSMISPQQPPVSSLSTGDKEGEATA